MRLFRPLVLVVSMLAAGPVSAQEAVGIPVTVRVADAAGAVIPTATIRHPEEEARHRVNTATGEWTDSVLYLPNGDELVFEQGLELEFEISAPGFNNARVKYFVRKRKNLVTVVLDPMELIPADDEEMEDPVTGFGRSVPRD